MKLHKPFEITARLLPGLRIGDGFLSLEPAGRGREGKPAFRWFVDIPAGEFSNDDFGGWGSLQEMFGSLLAFLGAAGESYGYALRTGREGDNSDLFPPAVVEWAYQNSDEISMLQLDIEETDRELIEN